MRICFLDEEVRAILEGRKTAHRVPFRHQPRQIKPNVLQVPPRPVDVGGLIIGSEAYFSCDSADNGTLVYRADGQPLAEEVKRINACASCREHPVWRSGAVMTEDASRLRLRVTEVKACRLSSLTEDEFYAEGGMKVGQSTYSFPKRKGERAAVYRGGWRPAYADAWDARHPRLRTVLSFDIWTYRLAFQLEPVA